MTTNKRKIHWHLNWILCAIIFVVLAIVFCYRYFKVGYPVEANWTEEVFKYLFMWPILTAICWTIAYVPFRMYSGYLSKKRGGNPESSAGDI